MRFDIDDPRYRDSNVGEEMLEPKHYHSNHSFTKETRICVECLEEIENKARLVDEMCNALRLALSYIPCRTHARDRAEDAIRLYEWGR